MTTITRYLTPTSPHRLFTASDPVTGLRQSYARVENLARYNRGLKGYYVYRHRLTVVGGAVNVSATPLTALGVLRVLRLLRTFRSWRTVAPLVRRAVALPGSRI